MKNSMADFQVGFLIGQDAERRGIRIPDTYIVSVINAIQLCEFVSECGSYGTAEVYRPKFTELYVITDKLRWFYLEKENTMYIYFDKQYY